MSKFGDIRKAHTIGRHVLAHSFGPGSWCRACSTWDCYLRPTDKCDRIPKAKRWWPQGWVGGPKDTGE